MYKYFPKLAVLFLPLLLVACGENLFSTKDPAADRSRPTKATAAAIITQMDAIISSSSDNTEISGAYADRAGAVMVQNDLSTSDIFLDVNTLNETSSGEDANIFNLVDSNTDESTVASVADSFNLGIAYAQLSSSSSLSNTSLASIPQSVLDILESTTCPSSNPLGTGAVKADQMLNAGYTNALRVIKQLNAYLEVGPDGDVTFLSSIDNEWVALNTVLSPLESPISSDITLSIVDYSLKAICYFTLNGAFLSDQLAEIEKFRVAVADIKDLKDAFIAGTAITISGTAYQLSQAYAADATLSSADNTIFLNALDAIFAKASQ